MDFDLLKKEIRNGNFIEAKSLLDKIEIENDSLKESFRLLIEFELSDKQLVIDESEIRYKNVFEKNDWKGIVYIGGMRTQLLHYMGKLTETIELAEEILLRIPNHKEISDDEVLNALGFLYNTYGNSLFRIGKYKEALDQYTKSLDIREQLNDVYSIGASLGNIANIYNETGELNTAEEFQLRALQHFEKHGNEYETRVTLNNLGVVYLDQGKLDDAEAMLIKSMEISKKYGDESLISTSYNNLGSIARSKNQLSEALDYYLLSLEIREHLQNSYQLAYSYYYLTLTYLDLGDMENAELYLQKAKNIAEENPNAKLFEMKYKILQAAKLKESVRHSHLAQAQQILSEIIEDPENYDVELKIQACIFQCEILLSELAAAHESDLNPDEEQSILDEVMEYTDQISQIADFGNLTGMKIQALILQSYIALSQFNTHEAEILINEAREMSSKFGIRYFPIEFPDPTDENKKKKEPSYSPGSLEVKKSINKIIHSLPKLRIVFFLYDKPYASFTEMKDSLGFTPGKLGKHCDNLVEVGYIEKNKEFDGNKFQTIYRLTPLGINEFKNYAETLKYQLDVVNDN